MSRRAPPLSPRFWALSAMLAVLAIGYFWLLYSFGSQRVVTEQDFVSARTSPPGPLYVYVDIISVDPVRQSMDMRLDAATSTGPRGTRYDEGHSDRDLRLRISDGETDRTILLHRNEPWPSMTFSADLFGTVRGYPFDAFSSHIMITASELLAHGKRVELPVHITVWEGVAQWWLHATAEPMPSGDLALAFRLERPLPQVFFACVIYWLMVMIACSALCVGALIYIGRRRIEATFTSALLAMVFALPVLRTIVPGSPPLGVSADVFILLWAELAVVVGLILFLIAWVHRGEPSHPR